jgi:beta-carotene ketolase (CrtW type)
MSGARQAATGLTLAAAIVAAWAALHVYSIFFLRLEEAGAVAPILVLALCWLNVGLFIVAHDAMHGSLAPGRPGVNLWAGRLALAFYAGFSFDRLRPKHFEHHRSPGTAADPDFSAGHPSAFWPWYLAFFRQYFGWRELAVLTGMVGVYTLLLKAPSPPCSSSCSAPSSPIAPVRCRSATGTAPGAAITAGSSRF